MELWGYGEDALTLHVVQKHLPEILSQLGDPTPASAVRGLYRASFGRGVLPGEFDLHLYTPIAPYFFETKWPASTAFKKGPRRLVLDAAQIDRHDRVVSLCHDGVPVPEDTSQLARHVRRLIEELERCDNRIPIRVALFVTHDPNIAPFEVVPPSFRLVVIHCSHMTPEGYILL